MKWLTIQPNLGGIAIGTESIMKTSPIAILVYNDLKYIVDPYIDYNREKGYNIPVFRLQDPYIKKGGNAILNEKSEYFPFLDKKDDDSFKNLDISNLDLVVSCPKCSGLSKSTNSFNSDFKRNADSKTTLYLRWALEYTLTYLKPKAYMFENGAALSEEFGEPLRKYINEVANKNGYSVSYIKENTLNYGLPHNRPRTMVICTKSKCPIFQNVHNRRIYLNKFFDSYPPESEESKYRREFDSKLYVRFAKAKFGDDWLNILSRSFTKRRFARSLTIEDIDLLDKLAITDSEKKKASKLRNKLSEHKNWFENDDLHFPVDYIGAILFKSFTRDVNVIRQRMISERDGLRLFGMPEDFKLNIECKREAYRVIGRNVPVPTSAYFACQILKYLHEELPLTDKEVQILDFYD